MWVVDTCVIIDVLCGDGEFSTKYYSISRDERHVSEDAPTWTHFRYMYALQPVAGSGFRGNARKIHRGQV